MRALSKDLKINPNTAHKVLTHLIAEGLLETRAGIGTVVTETHGSSNAERSQLLGDEIEELVVEAKKLGISMQDLFESITTHWKKLSSEDSASAKIHHGGTGKKKNHFSPRRRGSAEITKKLPESPGLTADLCG